MSVADRLDSWKEIAAFLGRGIRTVQRWEREEGLPVHRLLHDKRGSIYAQRDELNAWWESRRVSLATASQPAAPAERAEPVTTQLEQVTRTSALTNWPTLSSDARLVAYVSDAGQDGTTPQIWIHQIGGAALRLTNGDRQYSHLSFVPDNTRIVFTASDEAGTHVYEVPALGGDPRILHQGASCGVVSPDDRWFACVPLDAPGLRVATRGGAGFRTVAPEMVDISCMTWSPDSRSLLVHARPDSRVEPDWWVVPLDGKSAVNTGVVQRFREALLFTVPTSVAWVSNSFIFSAAGPPEVHLFRQRVDGLTFQPAGAPEQLTTGTESAWLPSAAAGHVLFFSSRADANLWTVALDLVTGVAQGPLRRMTRGPAPLGYLTLTSDSLTLAYFSFRFGKGDIFIRDLQGDSERRLTDGPEDLKGYPAVSPNGTRLAYGIRTPGGLALQPIVVANLTDGSWRTLAEDARGRPREWVDERRLVVERFARLNSIALIDTETAGQIELLESGDRSVSNPRVSPDRRWIAFDAAGQGESASVCVAPFREQRIPEAEWMVADSAASHPFWSGDGQLLYYAPTGRNPMIRSTIQARRFAPEPGLIGGPPIDVYASTEMLMPAFLPGTAPVATDNEIILVLGDFRGDLWLMDQPS